MLNCSSSTFKIFVGKIPEKTTAQDIRPLFEAYGKVLQCDVIKTYAFVHMEDPSAGYEAIRHLNGSVVNGVAITVEEARNRKRSSSATTKIFVSNIAADVKANDIRTIFSKFGNVAECDLVRNYGFVHIDTTNLSELLKELNGYEIGGQPLKVQISTSRIRQRPGMGNPQQCYKCGISGHWSKECTQASTPSDQFQYLTNSVPGVDARSTYPREFYSQPQSSAFLRDRILNSYSVPDMREYYEHFYQNAMEQYEDYSVMASRRDVYGNSTRLTNATEYGMFSRRSPNSNIAHYSTSNGNYNDYGGPITYTYSSEPYYTCGNYSSATATATPATLSTATATYVDGRPYEGFTSLEVARNGLYEERHPDRRDGTSRSSSRFTPY